LAPNAQRRDNIRIGNDVVLVDSNNRTADLVFARFPASGGFRRRYYMQDLFGT
jgi:hypothetical protein